MKNKLYCPPLFIVIVLIFISPSPLFFLVGLIGLFSVKLSAGWHLRISIYKCEHVNPDWDPNCELVLTLLAGSIIIISYYHIDTM